MREMTRENFKNRKAYLAENLPYYKNLDETIRYIINHEIPEYQLNQMYRAFESEHRHKPHDIRDMYIVTHDYLKMKYLDIVSLIRQN